MEKQDEAAEAMKAAMSTESMPEEAGLAEYVGKKQSGDQTYLLHKDRQGLYQYRMVFKTVAGYISEYKCAFGPKENRRRR